MFKLIIASLIVSMPFLSLAQSTTLTVVQPQINFTIAYSLGMHEGHSETMKGKIVLGQDDVLQNAIFVVPISSLKTGNKQRDCHLVEALGLDYKNSTFPEEHACDKKNNLPPSGPDSVKFGSIVFDFDSFVKAPLTPLRQGKWQSVRINGTIKIHGVIKKLNNVPVDVLLTRSNKGTHLIRLKSKLSLDLNDFNVEVKAFKVPLVGIKITVANKVDVDLDILMAE